MKLEQLVEKLWAQVEERQVLLNSALFQLADHEKRNGQKNERFVVDWLARHRKESGF